MTIDEEKTLLLLKYSTPHELFREWAFHVINPDPSFDHSIVALEEIFAMNNKTAYNYAMARNKPFKLGEPTIATDSRLSYGYALEILEGRFELAEPILAQDDVHAFYYAKYIIKKRFKLGEKTILCSKFRWEYLQFVAGLYLEKFKGLVRKK